MAVWWGTWAECAVTISRLKRDGHLNEESERETRVALDGLTADWAEIEPEDDMRLLAALLSKDYPLKTADALQLAAAVRWWECDTSCTGFVCLDVRLRRAASDEGFRVLPSPPEEGDEEL
jgi:predicted nucleic acid-binding protein